MSGESIDDYGSNENEILLQKGETAPIIKRLRELLALDKTRLIFYIFLIIFTTFPLLIDSVDVFGKGDNQYTGNAFCDNNRICTVSLISLTCILVSIILILCNVFGDYFSQLTKYISCGILFIGTILLMVSILIMTFKKETDPKRVNIIFCVYVYIFGIY